MLLSFRSANREYSLLHYCSVRDAGVLCDESCAPKPEAECAQVVDHYDRPRNVGSFDKTDVSVGTGLVGAPACGDVMKLQIKVSWFLSISACQSVSLSLVKRLCSTSHQLFKYVSHRPGVLRYFFGLPLRRTSPPAPLA